MKSLPKLIAAAALAMVMFSPLPLRADDAPADAPATRTEDAADSNRQPALETIRELATETVALMQQAQSGFADGELTDETASLQKSINERLERLAQLARQQATQASTGQSRKTGSGAGASTNAGDGQGAAERNPNAAESSEAATGADDSEPRTVTPRDLATSVWGHLPARQRDRMRARFSERFLPQYDQLVREYYEALATDGTPDTSDQGRVDPIK